MRDILKWSQSRRITCTLHTITNSANSWANSYFLLSKPNSENSHLSRSVLLVMHGTGNDAWYPQVNIISQGVDSGMQVVAVNLPGHGRSDQSLLDCDQLPQFMEELIRDVKQRTQCDRIFAWGQSLGAATIVKYLTNNLSKGDGIAAAILVSLPLTPHVNLNNVTSELLLPLLPTYWSINRTYGLYGSIPAFGWFKRSQFPIRMHNRHAGNSYIEVISKWFAQQDWRALAKQVRIPTLLLYGNLDRVALPMNGAELHKHMPGSRLVMLPWENHFTMAGSPKTADLSISFLREHSR